MLHYLLCVGADCTASNQETRRLWWQSPPLKEPSSAWGQTARRQSCIWPVVRLGSHGRHQSPWLRILYWRASEREHSLVLRRSLLESILTRLRHVQNFNHHAFVKLWYVRYEFAGSPNFSFVFHKPSLLTVSKALIRSAKVTKRWLFCSWHFSATLVVETVLSYHRWSVNWITFIGRSLCGISFVVNTALHINLLEQSKEKKGHGSYYLFSALIPWYLTLNGLCSACLQAVMNN